MVETEGDWVCRSCLQGEQLRALAEDDAPAAPCEGSGATLRTLEPRTCLFCGQDDLGMPAEELVQRVEFALRRQYDFEPENVLGSMERHLQAEGLWQRPGEPLADILWDFGLSNDAVRERVLRDLSDRDDPEGIGEATMDDDAHWSPITDSYHVSKEWDAVEGALLKGPRHFNEKARQFFGRVLGAYEAIHKDDQRRPAGSHLQKGQSFYRARVFEPYQTEAIGAAIADPAKHVGPPPPDFASAGRMNAQHVPVFYAANTLATAVAEVRPPVGSRVVVAQFKLEQGVDLFDLTRDTLDRFDPHPLDVEMQRHAPMARFLRDLRRIIARPVTPGRQSQDYVVTQAFCDYLASWGARPDGEQDGPTYHGIIFDSAQSGEEGARNVVLFAQVADRLASLGVSDKLISAEEYDEDRAIESYTVDVEVGAERTGYAVLPVLSCEPKETTVHVVGPSVPSLAAIPVRRTEMTPPEFDRRHRTPAPF